MAKTPLQKIKTQLDKLNKLHEKEEAIVEKINEIIEMIITSNTKELINGPRNFCLYIFRNAMDHWGS